MSSGVVVESTSQPCPPEVGQHPRGEGGDQAGQAGTALSPARPASAVQPRAARAAARARAMEDVLAEQVVEGVEQAVAGESPTRLHHPLGHQGLMEGRPAGLAQQRPVEIDEDSPGHDLA